LVQIKKESVRKATLDSAFDLFSKRGYANTTLKQIADGAGITTTNIYRYYSSKLDVLFAVTRPWLNNILDQLEAKMEKIKDPRARLGLIIHTMWCEIPEKDNGFHYNLIQALGTLKPTDNYSRDLLIELERRLSALLRTCLPESRLFMIKDDRLAHLLFMGTDGFAMGFGIVGPSRRSPAIVEDFCDILLNVDRKT